MSNKRALKRKKKKKNRKVFNPQSQIKNMKVSNQKDLTAGKIPMVNIIAYAADLYGCYLYRILNFQNALNEYNKRDVVFNFFSLNRIVRDENFYKNTTVVIFQRPSTPQHVEMMKWLRNISQKCGFLLVFEIDDLLFEIPKYNYFANKYYSSQLESVKTNLQLAHMCTTTTKYLQGRVKEYNKNVGILENYLPGYMWNMNGHRIHRNNGKLKIVWSGSATHFSNRTEERDDLEVLYEVHSKTCNKYQWIFQGSVPEKIKNAGSYKFIPWVQNHQHPRVLQNLDADVGIGSLVENNFNRAKSNIKRKEYVGAGLAGLFSTFPGCPYEDANGTYDWDNSNDLLLELEKLEDPSERQSLYDKELESLKNNLYIEDNVDKVVDFWRKTLRIP